jgi:hypothetical protein
MLLLQKSAPFVSGQQNRFLIRPVCPVKAPPVRDRPYGMVWVELVAGLMSVVLLAFALLSPPWMELFIGLSHDAGMAPQNMALRSCGRQSRSSCLRRLGARGGNRFELLRSAQQW